MGQDQSQPSTRRYGWVRDLPDHRDLSITYRTPEDSTFFNKVDLTDQCPPVFDQGHLGSCTANAISNAYLYDELKQNNKSEFIPSRLFIYYNERKLQGTVDQDSGSSVRTGMKTINTQGVCTEDEWPYDINEFTVEPAKECYDFAKTHHSVKYHRVQQTAEELKAALTHNYPVVFGFSVYSSMETEDVAKTGKVPFPTKDDSLLGGHCVLLVGYNDDTKEFKFMNSWGKEWGENGYGYLPYKYILNQNLASDFWTVTKVTDPDTPPPVKTKPSPPTTTPPASPLGSPLITPPSSLTPVPTPDT